ncbi:unnamed protein product [Cunninghamella blakesleeana]
MSKVYGFGSNGSGQLGLGHLEDTNVPQQCIGIPTEEKIKKIVGGGNHSVILTISGKVFMTGSSQLGVQKQKLWEKEQQTKNDSDDDNGKQKDHPLFWTIYQQKWSDNIWKDVACGWSSTYLVDDKGQVFGIGSSKFGELGSIMKDDQLELKRIAPNILNDIQSIACGWRHCIVLDRNGHVYGWGWGKHGQLGNLNKDDGHQLDNNNNNTNKVKKPTYIFSPFKFQLPEKISQITCGHLHTLFLNQQQNKLYGCGSNKYGQLNINSTQTTIDTITECNICIPSTYYLNNVHEDDKRYQSLPLVNKISTGWYSSLVLLENGELIMWGRNDHYQLQHELKNIQNAVSGSEHTLATTLLNNKILSWGWNEHGNCTTDKDDVLIPEQIQIINEEHSDKNKITLLGAGCATSWICMEST